MTQHLDSEAVTEMMIAAGKAVADEAGWDEVHVRDIYLAMTAARPVDGLGEWQRGWDAAIAAVRANGSHLSAGLAGRAIEANRPTSVDDEVGRVARALAKTETEGFTPEIEQILMDDLPAILAALTDTTRKE